MKFLHITDIHLDHLEATTLPPYVNQGILKDSNMLDRFAEYYNKKIEECCIDAILLTGDISTCEHLKKHLVFLESSIKAPIYFILGNHDYYGDKNVFDGKSQAVAEAIGNGTIMTYMSKDYKTISTDKTVGIVGVDGWYDGGYAPMSKSDLFMSDFFVIKYFADAFEYAIKKMIKGGHYDAGFSGGGKNNMFYQYHVSNGLPSLVIRKFKETADRFTEMLKSQMESLVESNKEIKDIIVLTHVPPFAENSIYKGKISDGDWLPYFSNKSLGDFLVEFAKANTNIKFVVLCGHSHGRATNVVLPNLICHTTDANYGEIYSGRLIEI